MMAVVTRKGASVSRTATTSSSSGNASNMVAREVALSGTSFTMDLSTYAMGKLYSIMVIDQNGKTCEVSIRISGVVVFIQSSVSMTGFTAVIVGSVGILGNGI